MDADLPPVTGQTRLPREVSFANGVCISFC